MPGIRGKAAVLLALNILGVGIWAVALKVIGGSQSTFSLLFLSFSLASLVSWFLTIRLDELSGFKNIFKSRRNAAVTAVGGILTYALPSILLSIGAAHISASLSSVLFRSWVLFTIPFIPLFLKTKINKYQVAAVALGFVSVYIAMTQGSLLNVKMQSLPFLMIIFLSAISVALGNLIIKSRNTPPMAQMLFFDICAAVAFGAVSIFAGQASLGFILAQMTAPNLLAIAFLGVVSYSIGSYFYLYALKVFDPVFVGNASLLAPFITFFFAAILLHETLQPYYIVLAVVVLAGVGIQQLSRSKAYERTSKRTSSPLIFDITGAFIDNKHPDLQAYLKSSGRALATKLKGGLHIDVEEKRNGCLFFTTKQPPEFVRKEEVEFIESILCPARDELVLVSVGDIDKAEKALIEHIL